MGRSFEFQDFLGQFDLVCADPMGTMCVFFARKKSRKKNQRNETDVLQGLNGLLDVSWTPSWVGKIFHLMRMLFFFSIGRLDMLQWPTHNICVTIYVVVSTLVDFHYKNRGNISELTSMFCQMGWKHQRVKTEGPEMQMQERRRPLGKSMGLTLAWSCSPKSQFHEISLQCRFTMHANVF